MEPRALCMLGKRCTTELHVFFSYKDISHWI
jgi:hypothetical protein